MVRGTLLIREERPPSVSVASFLSFIWPGLGQAFVGARRAATIQALPIAAVVAVVAATALWLGPAVTFVHLLQPGIALLAGVAIAVLCVWRIASIVDAALRARPWRWWSGSARVLVVALVAFSILLHGWAGSVVWSAYQAGQRIAQPIDPSTPPAPTGQSPLPTPSVSPSPTPLPLPQGRITVLLLGRDSADHSRRLTDTIQIASYDAATGEIAIIAVPRDTAQVPLSTGATWDRKINELLTYAESRPREFPEGGIQTLMRELGHVVGVPIQYYAQVDFAGFVRLVDAVGGVDVVLDRPIADPTYQSGPTETGFYMEPGNHHLDGETALKYVRSRHGPGNSDFQRARRQQQVLLALRDKVDDPAVVANLPGLIDAASQMVRTNVPLDKLPELVSMLQGSGGAPSETYVLRPPDYAEVIPRSEVGNVYMTRLKMDAVAQLSIELFGDDSRYFRDFP